MGPRAPAKSEGATTRRVVADERAFRPPERVSVPVSRPGLGTQASNGGTREIVNRCLPLGGVGMDSTVSSPRG